MLTKIIKLITILIVFTFIQQYNNYTLAQSLIAKMDNLNIDINNAYFQKANVGKLNITGNNVDLSTGKIDSITFQAKNIQIKDLLLDQADLTLKDISFNSDNLIHQKELVLKQPVEAQISILSTEFGLNTMLNQTKVLDKFSNVANAKIQKFGLEINGGLISFKGPKVLILANNCLQIDMNAFIFNLINFPVSFYTTLAISNNKIILTNPKLVTSGFGLPDNIAQILNDKINSLLNMEDKVDENFEIKVTSIQMTPGKSILVYGTTRTKKLRFGKKENIKN
jgi:hypothetical protein